MQVWKDQMALGLTTWAEQPEPSRSDCHAWGASPNIEFFRTILGINSDGPGFSRILIEPSGVGKLSDVIRAVQGGEPVIVIGAARLVDGQAVQAKPATPPARQR